MGRLIDLHTHTFLSDGELVASELVRRAHVKGYTAIGLTDHADASNLEALVSALSAAARELNQYQPVKVLAGVEFTHVPPRQIAPLVARARALGAQLVLVHGETIWEPVVPGTNRAALQCPIDILAHPGLVTEDDAALAAQNSIALEITARQGHCLANGHVARMAAATGAKLVLNTDGHDDGDLFTPALWEKIARGAAMTEAQIEEARRTVVHIVERRMPSAQAASA